MKLWCVTIQMKNHVAISIMLYKVDLTFKSVDETIVCDHSNESYWAVLSCGTDYYAVQGRSNFKSVDKTLKCVTIQMKAIEQCLHVVLLITLFKVALTFKSVNETLVCGHSNETRKPWSSTVVWCCQSSWIVLVESYLKFGSNNDSNCFRCQW